MIYTGIGSRSTPTDILTGFVTLAKFYAEEGHTLRTGGAKGADSAFQSGCFMGGGELELYLPWPGFEGRKAPTLESPQYEAYAIAAQFHPAWHRLSKGARRLHARNVHQILGRDVTNPVLSDLVVCWTPEGSGSGGTGQALRMAHHYGIKVIDFGKA